MAQDYRILKVTAGAATNGQVKMYDVSGNAATLTAPSLGGNVTITLPATTATLAGKGLNETISGNWTFTGTVTLGAAATGPGVVPLGAVLATFPNLSGAYSCGTTTAADSNGYVKCNGGVISDGTSPMNGVTIPNINNTVFLAGSTTAGTSGGAASVTLSTNNLPSHTHGAGTFATSIGISDGITITGGTASLTGTTTFAANGHTHTGAPHIHQWGYASSSQSYVYALNGASGTENQSSFNSGDGNRITFLTYNYVNQNSGTSFGMLYTNQAASAWTAGPANNGQTGSNSSAASVGISSTAAGRTGSVTLTGSNSVTGTSGSTGSGTSFSILPTYISAVYVMRIK